MEREKWRTFLWTRVVEVSFPTAPAARDSYPLHSSSVCESEYRGVGTWAMGGARTLHVYSATRAFCASRSTSGTVLPPLYV